MNAIPTSSPASTKIVAFSLLCFTLFFLFKHFSLYNIPTTPNHNLVNFNSTQTTPPPSPPPPAAAVVERTGIINEMGIMTDDFIVGEFDEGLIEGMVVNVNSSYEKEKGEFDNDGREVMKVEKFRVCEESMVQHIPCLDNVDEISRFNSSENGEKYERHCPENGRGLDCLVPRPKGYKLHIPWPKSRDEVWFNNIPYTHLVQDKGGQDSVSRKDDKFIFPSQGIERYLVQISKMAPGIAFGERTRVALDIGSGVASFGAYLMERNVTTLSIDVHENEIQFALERGIPAMVATFGNRRLSYPSQAFDLIHCSKCRINWIRDDGILLLEANRILRAGGYFVWAPQPLYEHENEQGERWKEMEDLTGNLCWELVSKEGYIAIWQKPLNNSCYLNRDPDVKPSLCEATDNPDDIWYVNLRACIMLLPENGYGANVTNWPARLHSPPDRLFSIQMDADKSRRELYKADSRYWNDIVKGYIGAFHVDDLSLRNMMDMKAGYGGFAAALLDFNVNSWVMNVVPVSGSNTLPVIYDRGLIGVMHDWCEPFDTYPRTYDLLNAAGLFSVEQKRCNITNIMLEMDRILRPGGRVYIRDTTPVIDELHVIAKAMGWVTFMFDSGEGSHSNWKLLTCEKRL
ncbi:Phosphoethanolamine N-methyltransferase [Handroanthus impetiginosus]|uniref:Methyltransferase n=1 Tax=Handroanthus impetiginosus TaxID=429701 RepID=A0A2G9HG18_9LAMI|nr:Phosphoethanolamine N-methyltransferase [Handroanthus impetiginosus]